MRYYYCSYPCLIAIEASSREEAETKFVKGIKQGYFGTPCVMTEEERKKSTRV